MRFRHIMSETWTAMRRNASMMVAIIVTMWVSLALFGAGLLAAQQIEVMKGGWYDKVEISIFLCTPDTVGDNCPPGQEVTAEQKVAVEQVLETHP